MAALFLADTAFQGLLAVLGRSRDVFALNFLVFDGKPPTPPLDGLRANRHSRRCVGSRKMFRVALAYCLDS